MAGQRTRRIRWVLAVALVFGGAWLLCVGASYMVAWLTYEAERAAALGSLPTCAFCPKIVRQYIVPPSPGPVSVSYLVAIPAILGIGWSTHRGSLVRRPDRQTVTRIQRAGSDALLGAMGWMAGMFALGLVWQGGPFLALGSGPPVPWSLFLISLLVVPVIVAGVGIALLWDCGRETSVAPSRASGG